MNEAVRDAIRLGAVGFKNGRIVCEFADHLPPVWADRTLIQQVVVNLVRNAIDAMAQSSEPALHIATAQDDNQVIIRVSDNGPGLAPAIAAAPFRAFATTKPTGLGLGLSICRSIIEAHGGSIDFTTGSDGATFYVRLPVAPAEPNVQAA